MEKLIAFNTLQDMYDYIQDYLVKKWLNPNIKPHYWVDPLNTAHIRYEPVVVESLGWSNETSEITDDICLICTLTVVETDEVIWLKFICFVPKEVTNPADFLWEERNPGISTKEWLRVVFFDEFDEQEVLSFIDSANEMYA